MISRLDVWKHNTSFKLENDFKAYFQQLHHTSLTTNFIELQYTIQIQIQI